MGLTKKQMAMVAVLVVGAFLMVLNATLLTPALPSIMKDLRVPATTVQWLASGYALIEAVIIPLSAYFLGRFRTKNLFVAGCAAFAAGSLVAALAPNFVVLLLGRLLQGAATGVVMPMVFTLILLIFPRERRGSAMGIVGLVISCAPAIGPSLSGVLVDSVGWRALFLLIVVLMGVTTVVSAFVLENSEKFDRVPFDGASVAVLAVGMTALLYGLGTFTSSDNLAVPVALMVAGAALLVVFVHRQNKLDEPLLEMSVMRVRVFAVAGVLILLMEGALIGSEVVLPLYVQGVLGESPTMSGLIMLPGALIGAVCGLLAGRWFDRSGVRAVAVTGGCFILLGGFMLTTYQPDTNVLEVCAVYTLTSVGIQFLITPINTWGFNALDNKYISHANSLVSTYEQVGASFGTALIVSLTALGQIAAPGESAAYQTYLGDHYAFIGVFVLLMIIAVGIFVFVRDGARQKSGDAEETESTDIAGVNRHFLVSDVMDANPITVSQDATVHQAIDVMHETGASGVPVLDGAGRAVGFLSDGDVIKYLSRQNGTYVEGPNLLRLVDQEDFWERLSSLLDLNVMRIATKRVVAINADDQAEDALGVLADKRIKKAPVVRNGKVVGTLSRRNVMDSLVEAQALLEASRAGK